jgi:bacteriocin-like protein
MTMNTDKWESTGNVSLSKKGTSAHDLNELSDRELQLVTGGGKGPDGNGPPGHNRPVPPATPEP